MRLLLPILLLAALAAAPAAAYEDGTTRSGATLKTLTYANGDPGPTVCERRCLETEGCVGFVYVKPLGKTMANCRLKSEAEPAIANACCVSGLVGAAAEAEREAKAAAEEPVEDIVKPAVKEAARACFDAHRDDAPRSDCLTTAATEQADDSVCLYDATGGCAEHMAALRAAALTAAKAPAP